MSGTNQYLPFGTGGGANVITPSAYATHSLRPLGHQPGVALSEVANTTWRQASVAASAVAQLVTEIASVDMLDDGSVDNYKNGVLAAIRALVLERYLWAPGMLLHTAGAVPAGWLLCDGSIVSRDTYAALFTAIGTTYGAGNGSTTFQLPDLRGEFLRGLDAGRGVDAGRVLGSAQGDMLKAHVHAVNLQQLNSSGTTDWGKLATGNQESEGTIPNINTESAGGAETRPRNVAFYIIIKT